MTRAALRLLLERTYGNIGQAAAILGCHRVTLGRRLKRAGLQGERRRVLKRLAGA